MTNEEKAYKVVIAPSANDRMAEHFEFLASVSVDAANRLLDELMEDIQSLERMPYRNPTYDRPYVQPGKYRYLICAKRYRIVYQIGADTVFIDDIHDSRQSDNKDMLNPINDPE